MGATHYWYQPEDFGAERWKACISDVRRLLPEFERLGVKLVCDSGNSTEPIINDTMVRFSGPGAAGNEVFLLNRRGVIRPGRKEAFSFCKTAMKPYDLAVMACLIVAKHHFGDAFRVSSDNDHEKWNPGRELCVRVLGYGSDFKLDKDTGS